MTKFNTQPAAALGTEAKLTQKFVEELFRTFMTAGPETITKLLNDNPNAYLRLIAGLPVPSGPTNPIQGLTDDELDHALAFIRKTLPTRKGTRKRTRPAPQDKPAEPVPALPETEGVP